MTRLQAIYVGQVAAALPGLRAVREAVETDTAEGDTVEFNLFDMDSTGIASTVVLPRGFALKMLALATREAVAQLIAFDVSPEDPS